MMTTTSDPGPSATTGPAVGPPQKAILFVDDEQAVLDGLRNLLRKQRTIWKMSFVTSGAAALEHLAKEPVDVVVSDMRMPQMDGATLLKEVQQRHPSVVRIVLSGFSEMEAALRTVPVAHQFLSKPCEPQHLQSVIERSCALHTLLADAELRRVIGSLKQLPSAPRTYHELTGALANPKTSAEDVACILEKDIAMSAKVLQLVNSGFFGLGRRMTSVHNAVSYLGFSMIKNIVLSAEVFSQFEGLPGVPGFSIERLQLRSAVAAGFARKLLRDKQAADDAFTAAMLADIGLLALAAGRPEHLKAILVRAVNEQTPLYVAEHAQGGMTHAEVGGYLLSLWGLPYSVVEAVTNHHGPRRVSCAGFDVLAAVHVAVTLAEQAIHGADEPPAAAIDEGFLEGLGMKDKLEGWCATMSEAALAAQGGKS